MKKLLHLLTIVLLISCNTSNKKYRISILNEGKVNVLALKNIDAPEKALVFWYLFAYGNECEPESTKNKCEILKILNVTDECNPKHLNNLLQWFSTDMLAVYKLNKCPNLPSKSAIQNSIDKIILVRDNANLSIEYKIKGINNSQEKSWNIEKTDHFIIKNNTLQRK